MCSYRALIKGHDTSTLLIQYYALKYHSHYSRLLKHNPAHDRCYLKTPHTSHLTPVTSHSEPETQPQSTISLSIVHCPLPLCPLDGMKGKCSEDRWMLFGIVIGGYTSAYKTCCPNEDILTITSLIIIITSGYTLS